MSRPTTIERKHPNQPIGFGKDGCLRFKKNLLIDMMLTRLSRNGLGLNQLHILDESPGHEDYIQLLQLIGVSVGHFNEHDCVPEATKVAADAVCDALIAASEPQDKCGECGADDRFSCDCIPF